jgi:hypothetical protein
MAETSLEQKVDEMREDIAFLKGQWSAIPPSDLVKLSQTVAANNATIYSISGIVSLVVAGVFSFFFRGGHSS